MIAMTEHPQITDFDILQAIVVQRWRAKMSEHTDKERLDWMRDDVARLEIDVDHATYELQQKEKEYYHAKEVLFQAMRDKDNG